MAITVSLVFYFTVVKLDFLRLLFYFGKFSTDFLQIKWYWQHSKTLKYKVIYWKQDSLILKYTIYLCTQTKMAAIWGSSYFSLVYYLFVCLEEYWLRGASDISLFILEEMMCRGRKVTRLSVFSHAWNNLDKNINANQMAAQQAKTRFMVFQYSTVQKSWANNPLFIFCLQGAFFGG